MLTARQEQQHPQNNNNSGKHTWKKAMPSMAFYYYTFLMVKINKTKSNKMLIISTSISIAKVISKFNRIRIYSQCS